MDSDDISEDTVPLLYEEYLTREEIKCIIICMILTPSPGQQVFFIKTDEDC